jgi:hypothetical protein
MIPLATRLIPAVLLLAACVPEVPPVTSPDPNDVCGASALQGLVGQPASVLDGMRFSRETRIIRPDTAVTMDFRENRLNIEIDRAEKISRVACG